MSKYAPPVRDIHFVLFDVLGVEAIYQRLGYEAATRDVIEAVLDEAARFTSQVLAPLNKTGDEEGCHFANGEVRTPKGFKEAYQQFVAAGWSGLVADPQYGGQGLPESLGAAAKEMIDSANLAWGTYPLLSHGASESLKHVGEEWQREVFLKAIVDGRWTGTMCLTEPHCGSDLGLLKTRAEPQADGSYKVFGTKIFITAGEHDFTDNIVHLVLARLPDAPAGTKGISLFIVPKFKVARDGTVGERNTVACGSIEHKMGLRASATCVMNFDGAEGYLIGQANKGLAAMFIMMNTARLAVGIQGLALVERAYQNSLAYARDRLQMRSLSGAKRPDKPADPIIVHPDVRRMLLTQKAIIEPGRALSLYAYLLVDIQQKSSDAAERQRADELVSFLTPIVKALLTELAVECTYHALQIFGGHGYIKEWGMEQLARDARITTLYEGTTQIQALDLLGRKIMGQQAAGLRHFLADVAAFCAQHRGQAGMDELIGPLERLAAEWQQLTQEIGQAATRNAEEVGAASVDYLFYSGYVVLAYFWAKEVAALKPAHGEEFRTSKLATARFYFTRILPRTLTHAAGVRAGSASVMELPEPAFSPV
ncbi:MAG TPA: acyl-CoA dehydrogenase C-terminal domain-containing protein [Xanthomonadales bacterium]|nr:acyl-CoA dehydrogenase C-terminal domain-containing protein [Xanthomonadales bacterium]